MEGKKRKNEKRGKKGKMRAKEERGGEGRVWEGRRGQQKNENRRQSQESWGCRWTLRDEQRTAVAAREGSGSGAASCPRAAAVGGTRSRPAAPSTGIAAHRGTPRPGRAIPTAGGRWQHGGGTESARVAFWEETEVFCAKGEKESIRSPGFRSFLLAGESGQRFLTLVGLGVSRDERQSLAGFLCNLQGGRIGGERAEEHRRALHGSSYA